MLREGNKTEKELRQELAELRKKMAQLEKSKRQPQPWPASKEKEERYKALFDRSLFCVYIHDFKGHFLDANKAALDLLGYKKEDILSLDFSSLLEEDQASKAFKILEEVRKTGFQKKPEEYKLRKKGGGHVWVEVEASLIYRKGRPFAIQGIARDISGRKRAEEQLKASLKEKEVLLKEVHHRVKNNLQFIFSLFNLQSQYVKDERALGMLKNCQHRIHSMQLIHERMYQSKESGKIEFAPYIRSLVAYLFQSYNVYSKFISLKTEIEDVLLEINTAIPCGLIINELLSNSLKHAFPKNKFSGKEENLKKEIRIKLSSNGKGLMTLVVSDNGVGLPQEFDLHQSETMGLKLVRDLVDQLNGTLILERKGGTEFKISFSAKK